MRIALGADHAGYELKQKIRARLEQQGIEVDDKGTIDNNSVDYPDYARQVGHDVADKKVDLGILVCGSGIGMAIAANRHPGIRAAVLHDSTEARLTRAHNDANVAAFGARLIGAEVAQDALNTFLATAYEGGRHDRRLAKLAPPPKAGE